MAEGIAFSIVTTLITKLGAVAFNEISLVYGVEDKLGKLKDTLSTIEAALLDADQRKEKSHLMKEWIKKLNDAVYDADDLLDAFATKALQRELNTTDGRISMKVRDFFSSSNQLAFRYKLGHSINEIRERFDEIAANMSKFNFTERLIVQASVDNSVRETISFVSTSDIIGREKDKEEILKLIMSWKSDEENVTVITIVGMGGLGKTALTQLVYNDQKVVEYFELRLWVCVSEDFEKKSLVKKILKSLTNNEVAGDLELEQLQIRLRENLNGKRFLLVLDDIWNEIPQKWEPVKALLMGGAEGSKIMVSTRSSKVASVMGTENPYIMKGLSDEQSWTLFENVAFGGHETVHSNLVVIGKEIVEKCKGVPLAIRSLASLMQSKTQEESEWLSIRNSDVWSLCQDDGDVLPILKLSYDHLPIQLRQCIAYCSIFPKDYEIQKEVLIQLWMAQGYVQSPNSIQCLEDIGDHYFSNLLSRSFFQDATVNDYNEVISCKMHDLIHDLAVRVASFDCSFLEAREDNISDRVHHVSIAYQFEELPRQMLKAKGLRTILLKDNGSSSNVSKKIELMSQNFTCLRVLDVQGCWGVEVPSSIAKLQHLRYLDLSENHMESLPNSIRKLVNLQTLKLSRSWLKRLPEGITKLINLRYLVTDGCSDLEYMPSGMGKLSSLRRLNKFVVGGNKGGLQLRELNRLNELKGDVSIEGLENVEGGKLEAKEATLMAKEYLHSLKLEWGDNPLVVDGDMDEILLEGLQPHSKLRELRIKGYRGQLFPSWMATVVISLPNIVRITLKRCDRCKHLPQSLDQLPSLKFLTLHGLEEVEHINEDENNNNLNGGVVVERKTSSTSTATATAAEGRMSIFFPSLEELLLYKMPKLKGWWKAAAETETSSTMMTGEEEEDKRASESSQRPSFPRLTTLRIDGCPELTSMPIHLPHLETLHLISVPERLVRQLLLLVLTTTSATTSTTITEEGSAATSSSSYSSIPSPIISSKLKSLWIKDMESLPFPEEEVLWKNLSSSLDTLVIEEMPKLVSLPVGLQQLTTLQRLEIAHCPGLMALPDWISNLISLQRLDISNCHPLLSERCQEETGEDWSIISHIPRISTDLGYILRRD